MASNPNKVENDISREQDEQYERIVANAEKITQQIAESAKYAQKLSYSFDKIDSTTKQTIKKLQEANKSEDEINKILEIRLKHQYEQADAMQKYEMNMAAMENKRAEDEKAAGERALELAEAKLAIEEATTDEAKKAAETAAKAAEDAYKAAEARVEKDKENEEAFSNFRNKSYKQYLKDKEKQDTLDNKKRIAMAKEIAAAEAKAKAEAEGATDEDKEAAATASKEAKQARRQAWAEEQKQNVKDNMSRELTAAIKGIGKQLDNAVNTAVNVVSTYMAKIDYRLEGAGKSWDEIYKLTRKNLGSSALVSQQKVIEKIGQAVDKGIAYNVEQRAFLSEVSEKIQGTFDAFDSNLLRLIRIQSQDSTAARLGMEKALNEMLNTYYKDTSYLNDLYDSISSALFEMTGTQSATQSVQTEYIVQKWLGSLYSVGASGNALQQIAQGIGYLGSGNVQALSSNTSLQTLLALSASKAGLDYAELLTGGLTAADTNELLNAMVKYLAEIADSTAENKVVTSAFGNVFGLSLSDIKSFANLASTASSIYGESIDYTGALGVTSNALSQLPQKLGTAQMIQTAIENVTFNTGMMYSNGILYGLYKAVDLLGALTGGGPEFKVSPWGIGLSFNVVDMLKSTMFGAGLIGSLISSGANPFGGNTLKGWGAEEYNTRGTGSSLRAKSGSSYSATVGNQSSEDVQEQSLKEGMEQSEDIQSQTGATEKDMYEALVKKGDKELVSNIKLRIDSLDDQVSKAKQLVDELSNSSSKRSLNINIQKVNGKELQGDNIPTSPDQAWEKLIMAATVLIKYGTIMGGFGGGAIQTIAANNAETSDKKTIQDFLDLFVPLLENSAQGLPVRIESTDSISNLMADLNKR